MRKTASSVKRPTPWTTAGEASGRDEPRLPEPRSWPARAGAPGASVAASAGAGGDEWETAPPLAWQQSSPIARHTARCDAFIGQPSETQTGTPNSSVRLLSSSTVAVQRQPVATRLMPPILPERPLHL